MNLKQVDLNLLVALDALLKERNLTRAGRRMGLSQPAMSATLGRLRDLFGDPLLERVGREYRLTPLALDLALPLQTLLASIERTLESTARFDPKTAQRSFRVATSDYVLCVLLQPLIERMSQLAPGIRLHFQPIDNALARDLATRRIDLSIQPPGQLQQGYESQELFSDSWVCAIWRGHPEIGERITREQFQALPHASFSLGQGSMAERFFGNAGLKLHVPVTSVNFVALPFLLRGTRLVAVIQRLLGERLQEATDIRLLDLPISIGPLRFSMWWNPLSNADPAHAWLRETMAEAARSIEQS